MAGSVSPTRNRLVGRPPASVLLPRPPSTRDARPPCAPPATRAAPPHSRSLDRAAPRSPRLARVGGDDELARPLVSGVDAAGGLAVLAHQELEGALDLEERPDTGPAEGASRPHTATLRLELMFDGGRAEGSVEQCPEVASRAWVARTTAHQCDPTVDRCTPPNDSHWGVGDGPESRRAASMLGEMAGRRAPSPIVRGVRRR
jgi:hypothetical protein